MCENGCHFVEWKEHFVSQERGNRVVHYFLKDSAGESVLAVVGTERSVRHMFYVVSEEFVRAYGAENSIHAGFKWRSRREVVDWLTSMLSKQNSNGDWSKSPKHDSGQPLGSSELPTNGAIVQRSQVANDMGRLPVNLSVHNWDIVWSGIAWMCGKQLKHYPSFCRNGTKIAVRSFVFVMGKGDDRYVAYLEDMYEDKRGQKKVKVRWFHHTREVKGCVPLRNPHPKEVFITPHAQVISAECVDGPATVLTREHYEECLASFPNALLAKVHMCFRQFRNNKVKPFDLSKLRGYFNQPILSCLSSTPFLEPNPVGCALNGEEEDEEPSEGEHVKLGAKRTKSTQVNRRFESVAGPPGTDWPMITYESLSKKLKYGVSGKRSLTLGIIEKQSLYDTVLKADAKIELLCHDSGIRGCWFRCTVVDVSRKQIKVQYDDVQDEDGYGNLEEWVPAFKLAVPDKLGMRSSDRPTIRPAPPDTNTTNCDLAVGTAVDAWWSDGWWEGVVTGVDNSNSDNLQIYVPGENLFLNMHKKDLRISRDWVGDQWIDIEAKPEILAIISSAISLETKVSMSSTLVQDVKSNCLAKLISIEEGKPDSVTLATSGNNLKQEKDEDNKDDDDDQDVEKPSPVWEEDKDLGTNDIGIGLDHKNAIQDHDKDDFTPGDDEKGKLEAERAPSEHNNTEVTA